MSLLRELGECIKKNNTLVPPAVRAALHIDWHVAYARPILMKLANVPDNTMIWWRWHRGLSDPQTSVLSGQREARPVLLLLSPWGFLTQNKQKLCFLGLLKSCRHLVLYRGQIIYHSALPCSASVALLFSDFYSICCVCWPLHAYQCCSQQQTGNCWVKFGCRGEEVKTEVALLLILSLWNAD